MFFIMEIQKQSDGTSAYLMQTATTREEAEAKFHGILQYAATSTLYAHSACIVSDEGVMVKKECYYHIEKPTPEPEPEEVSEE